MTSPRPLFFIGNKRSGTSILARVLNVHPAIRVTHESDVIWLLYQLRDGWTHAFARYPWDGSKGLERTLRACGQILDQHRHDNPRPAIRRLFEQIQRRVLALDDMGPSASPGNGACWLGDKKPVQQCDPALRSFLYEHFDDARYLHVVRHPAAVVASKMAAAASWSSGVPPYWRGSAEEILDRWTIHEEWVEEWAEATPDRVHHIRLEDLSSNPRSTIGTALLWLGLRAPRNAIETMVGMIDTRLELPPDGPALPWSARTRRMMRRYGYTT